MNTEIRVHIYNGILLFIRSVMSDSLWPHGLQHTRLPCPSPSPRACLNSGPLSWWFHPTILSSGPQSFPASRSFLMSWLFTSGGQSTGASASVLPMSIQGWFPLGLTGLISLQSKGLSRVFSSTTDQRHQYYSAIKKNAFQSVLMRWVNVESVIQSEVRQKEKDEYCIINPCV